LELTEKGSSLLSSHDSGTGPHPEAKEPKTTHPTNFIYILILPQDLRILLQESHPLGFRNEWQQALHELTIWFISFLHNFYSLFSPKYFKFDIFSENIFSIFLTLGVPRRVFPAFVFKTS
jgi:hypothetical protein